MEESGGGGGGMLEMLQWLAEVYCQQECVVLEVQ